MIEYHIVHFTIINNHTILLANIILFLWIYQPKNSGFKFKKKITLYNTKIIKLLTICYFLV